MISEVAVTNLPVLYFLFFVLGLLWGSFYNVCISRLPQEQSVIWGRSKCPKCSALIPWFCNIPLLSYLALKGKCRSCKNPISLEYPLIELISGILFVGLFHYYGFSKELLSSLIFCSALLIVSVIDIHHQIIPDEISLPGIILGFVFSLWIGNVSWIESLLGILVGGGAFLAVAWGYEKVAKREGLGGGDIKLLAMIGAWLGVQSILIVIVLSSLMGTVVGIGAMIFQKKDFKTAIPFGPFLALAAIIYLLFSNEIQSILFPQFNL